MVSLPKVVMNRGYNSMDLHVLDDLLLSSLLPYEISWRNVAEYVHVQYYGNSYGGISSSPKDQISPPKNL